MLIIFSFALIEYYTAESAAMARRGLNGVELHGKHLIANFPESKSKDMGAGFPPAPMSFGGHPAKRGRGGDYSVGRGIFCMCMILCNLQIFFF